MESSPPTSCPRCGKRETYSDRYTTPGWRIQFYECDNCGRRYDPYRDEEYGVDY